MIEITFPDGAVKEYKKGISPIEIARSISNSLAKNLLSDVKVTVKMNQAL